MEMLHRVERLIAGRTNYLCSVLVLIFLPVDNLFHPLRFNMSLGSGLHASLCACARARSLARALHMCVRTLSWSETRVAPSQSSAFRFLSLLIGVANGLFPHLQNVNQFLKHSGRAYQPPIRSTCVRLAS